VGSFAPTISVQSPKGYDNNNLQAVQLANRFLTKENATPDSIRAVVAQVMMKRTAAEISAGVTPVNYWVPSHDQVGFVLLGRYGAAGDCDLNGTGTDDTTAINNANAVAAAMPSKGTVLFYEKLYKTTGTIAIPTGVSWYCHAQGWTNTAGTAWSRGAGIFKAHNNDAVTIAGVGSEVHGVSIQSKKATWATGNGFVVTGVTCKLYKCNVRLVGGDSFVYGDGTTAPFTNYLTDCYSNNPGGRNYVINANFTQVETIQSDGGTIGVEWGVQAFGTSARNIHCEGFTSRFWKFNGGGGISIDGWNYGLINDAVTSTVFVEFVSSIYASNIFIKHMRLAQAAKVAGTIGVQFGGVSDGLHNVKIDIVMETSQIDLPIDSYGGNYNRVHHSTFDGQTNVFKQRSDQFYLEDCVATNTSGTTAGIFTSGQYCRYRRLTLDKPLHSSGTLIDATNKARDIIGFATYARGQTAAIASGTLVAHGLPDTPAWVGIGARTLNVGSDAYLTTANATNIAYTWAGGSNTQYYWEAKLACHED